MDIRCPSCATLYEFDDSRIGPDGVNVRCSACGQVFKVRAEAPEHPAQWMVRRRESGETIYFDELSTLQRWILEQKVDRSDQISKSGDGWRSLGEIRELSTFFQVIDELHAPREGLLSDTDGFLTADVQPPPAPSPRPQSRTSPQFGLGLQTETGGVDSDKEETLLLHSHASEPSGSQPDDRFDDERPERSMAPNPPPPPGDRTSRKLRSTATGAGVEAVRNTGWTMGGDAPAAAQETPWTDADNAAADRAGSGEPALSGVPRERSATSATPIAVHDRRRSTLLPVFIASALLAGILGLSRCMSTTDSEPAPAAPDPATSATDDDEHLLPPDLPPPAEEPAPTDEREPEEASGQRASATPGPEPEPQPEPEPEPQPEPEPEPEPEPQPEPEPEPVRSYDALMDLGNRSLQSGDADGALQHFSDAADARPNSAEAHVGVARAYQAIGRGDLAIMRYQRATRVNSRYTPAWLELGDAHRSSGDTDGAIEAYERVLSIIRAGASAERAREALEELRP